MSFEDAVLRCLTKYAVFSGRARPAEFWWFVGLFLGTAAAAMVTDFLAPGLSRLLSGATLALVIPLLAVTVRRLHDIGANGWTLVFLVPFLGQALMLWWLARPSVPRLNRHGPEPTKNRQKTLLFVR